MLAGCEKELQRGFDVLARLTDGKVHLSALAGREGFVAGIKGVEHHTFEGKHPAGNVGVQIHHIDPVAKGEIVWSMNIQDVAVLGRLFLTGRLDMSKTVAVAGSEIDKPQYCRIIAGAPVRSLLDGNVRKQQAGAAVRIISGNVLTGRKVEADGYISADADMLTVIPEGDRYELLGWAMPRFHRSRCRAHTSRGYVPARPIASIPTSTAANAPSWLRDCTKSICPWTSIRCICSKAILAQDIDKMESLGIYEVLPEDFALCEFVDPSKIEIQQIVRDGINLMIKES